MSETRYVTIRDGRQVDPHHYCLDISAETSFAMTKAADTAGVTVNEWLFQLVEERLAADGLIKRP